MNINVQDDLDRASGKKKRYDGANIRFFTELVPNEEASTKAGRPIYDEIELFEIHWPGGDKRPRPIQPQDIQEYPELYKAFKGGQEQITEGTPLTEWSMMPKSAAAELAYFGIRTVEQLAGATDEVKRKMGTVSSYTKKAKEWLKAAGSDQVKVAALSEQLEKTQATAKKLEDQLAMALLRIESLEGHVRT
jgi:hypothetical protein